MTTLPRAPTFPAFDDAVKHVDDSDYLTSPAMPDVPVVPLPVASRSRLRGVLLWRDPKVSGAVFGCCMLFFYLTLFKGLSILSVVGALAAMYLVVGLVVVNVNRVAGGQLDKYIARPAVGTPFLRKESVSRWADTFLEEGNELAEDVRAVIYCDDAPLTLTWIAASVTLFFAGKYFSLLPLFFAVTLAAFTAPLAYEKNKEQVDDALAKASESAAAHGQSARKAAGAHAARLRDTAADRAGPLLDKAPPAARDFAAKLGITPKKKAT